MNQSPIRTILLPAMLTAGTVFSILTSIIVTDQIRSNTESLTASIDAAPQYALREQQRSLAIRNVGLCILVSATSGLAVAGGIRKLQSTRHQTHLKHQSVLEPITEFLSSRPE